MPITERLDAFQRRHGVFGFPLAVIFKFFEDAGNYMAVVMAYYSLVAIVPLLLLGSSILGVVLQGHPQLQERLLDSAVAQVPVVGDQLSVPSAFTGGTGAVVIGVLGSLYGTIGVAQALQYAGNTIWHIPRNSRPNPFLARGRSFLLVGIAGTGMVAVVIGIAILHGYVKDSTISKLLVSLLGVIIATLVLLVAFQIAHNKPIRWSDLLPGALFTSVMLQVLQNASYVYVDHVIRRASTTNAIFAAVLGLLAYLYLAGLAVVFSMELNVVRAERLWPRALWTPFTDHVDLTYADEHTYTWQAQAQRSKGFQRIDVSFHEHRSPQNPDGTENPVYPDLPDRPEGSAAVQQDQQARRDQ